MPSLRSRWNSFSARHLSFFSPALLGDWVVVLVLGLLGIWIERQYPFEKDVKRYLGDRDVSWPFAPHERVTVRQLDLYSFWLPWLLIAIISVLRRSLHELHHATLAFIGGKALFRVFVEFVKNRVGRLRPDFLDRCAYSALSNDCTGPYAIVKDGRRSFPSGAFQGLFFLCLFLAGKNGAFAFRARFPRSTILQSRLLRLAISLSPLIPATWICITRLEDRRHHVTDVLAGASIGAFSALIVYLIYFPNPFDSSELGVMDKAKMVYGDEDEGSLILGQDPDLEEGQHVEE